MTKGVITHEQVLKFIENAELDKLRDIRAAISPKLKGVVVDRKKYWTATGEQPGAKTPPQMTHLLKTLADSETPLSVEDWAAAASEGLNTRQDPRRVLDFYRGRMKKEGLIIEA